MTHTTHNQGSATAPAALIAAVAPGSPAAAAGIEAGDRLVAIAGVPVRDYVDYKFLSADERVEVAIVKPDGAARRLVIEKHPDEDLGLDFLTDLFDGIRRCRNRCVFCFYDQLPKGLRETLYVRDDDFRLSFFHGNFITLTNLTARDRARICEQRLSPLYISVHATDTALRQHMLGNPRAPNILTQMRRLADCSIEMHAQVVLCPGVNDGDHLSRTIADLAELHPAVASVAIVPVGLTKHRTGLPELRPVDAAAAREVLERVRRWHGDFLDRLGTRFVYASDEIHALAGADYPPASEYEGFPQRDNGVGLARLFLDELDGTSFAKAAGLAVTLVTGVAARDLVETMARKMREQGVRADVAAVANGMLGDTITVAGLLAGEDVAAVLASREIGDVVAVPASALRDKEFLDSVATKELSRRLGKRVIHAGGPKELAAALARLRRRARKAAPTPTRAERGSPRE
ncbi:MAG: DUF512 domain-containing protein [Armatimonadota bacterium]|nr:MAG: DUF512 domain-containing protein [Armatimonadota bacterium]